jgi:hypothetical protein
VVDMTVANYPDPRPVDPVAPTSAAAGAATLRALEHRRRRWSASLLIAGAVMAVAAAWGAAVVYAGPAFGFSGDGSTSWQWTLSHSLLALIPGATAVVVGLVMMALALRARLHRTAFVVCGLIAVLCAAWFVMGPVAWPVLYGTGYFVAASPLRSLAYHIGYALGPGLIVAACGAYAVGWGAAGREESELGSTYGLSGRLRTTPSEAAMDQGSFVTPPPPPPVSGAGAVGGYSEPAPPPYWAPTTVTPAPPPPAPPAGEPPTLGGA